MKSFELKGIKRSETTGKNGARKLRAEGNIPCIMYGGEENLAFYVPKNSLINLIYTPRVYIVKLDIDGQNYDVIIKDIQFHPVTDDILHIDFFEIAIDKKIIIDIPVHITGDSIGIKKGGKLQLIRRKLKVEGMVGKLPESLEIDITNVDLGKSLKVKDLSFGDLEILHPDNDVVCSVKLTRTSRAGGGEMGEEGEEGEGEEAAATAEESSESAGSEE